MHDMSEVDKNIKRRVVVFTTYDIIQSETIFKESKDFNAPALYKFYLSQPMECSEKAMEEYLKALGCETSNDERKQFETEQIGSFAGDHAINLPKEILEKSSRVALKREIKNGLTTDEAKEELDRLFDQLKDVRTFMRYKLKKWMFNKTTEELKGLVAQLDNSTLQMLNFRRGNWERRIAFKIFSCPTNDDSNGAYALWPLEQYCEDREEWYDAITEEILSLDENKNCGEIYFALHNRDLFDKHEYEVLPDPAKRDDEIVRKVLVFQHINDKAHAILNSKGAAKDIVKSVKDLFPKDEEVSQLINMELVFEELSDALISRPIQEESLKKLVEKLKQNNEEQFKDLGVKVEQLINNYSDSLLLELVQWVGKLISKRYS